MLRLLPALCASWAAALLPAQVNATLIQPRADVTRQQLRATGPGALAAAAAPAVVHVAVEVGSGTFRIERPGNGVIVDGSGLVLTWLALVQEAVAHGDKRVLVQTSDLQRPAQPATIVGSDAATGLCLLSMEPAPGKPFPCLELADAQHFADGEPVLVLALPEGKDRVAFAGIASHAPLAIPCAGVELAPANVVLTDARIDRRCHGAALLDASGRLLGLCSSEHVKRDVSEPTLADLKAPSFGFAISADAVRKAFAAHFTSVKAANATLHKAPAADPVRDGARLSGTAAAVARCRPAIVSVWGGSGEPPAAAAADDPYSTRRREQLGSGVIVTASGSVLTNRHLVRDGSAIRVTLADGRTFTAEVKGSNAPTNLALLQLKLPASTTLPAIDCGSDQGAILGETLIAIGNPSGSTPTLSAGVLSLKRRGGRVQADPNLGNHNGGGALVDVQGRLLGIVDGGIVDHLDIAFAERGEQTKTETNLSTAIGIDAIRKLFPADLDLPVVPGDAERRQTPVTRAVAASAAAMLNVYVSRSSAQADSDANPFAEHKQALLMVEGLGSGVIIDRSGLALSNWHVVAAATNPDGSMRKDHEVKVRLFDNREFRVRVLSISREDDLALLQLVPAEPTEFTAVELGDSDAMQPGEQVIAIGNPHGFANTITAGVVAAKNQDIQIRRRWDKLRNLIEADAAINAGNSGGALLDLTGSLVGINSAGSYGFSLQGYAIPVNHVRRQVLELLLSPYKLRSPDLGLKLADREGRTTVLAVDPEGPAHRAGIAPGDVVLTLDGTKIDWSPAFALALRNADASRDVELRLQQQGKERTVKLRPLSAAAAAVQRQTGLEVTTLTFREAPDLVRSACIAQHRRFTNDPRAEPTEISETLLRITRVHPDHQPKEADLQPGDLILAVERHAAGDNDRQQLTPFLTVEDLQRCINDPDRGSYEGTRFRIWLFRSGKVQVTELLGKRLLW